MKSRHIDITIFCDSYFHRRARVCVCVCVCSCGEVLSVMGEFPAAGDLVTVEVDKTGRAEFRCTSEKLKVPDLIGRSLSISNSTNG